MVPTGWSPDIQATFCATLVDEWVRCGLTDVVICPGSRSTPLAVAFDADGRVTTHLHHDERSGSFLALGLAATQRRAVAIVTTSGSATVNMHPAVVEADLAGVPMIVCTANRPSELQDVAAPQTVNQHRLYGQSVRWFVDAGTPDGSLAHTWRSLASRAWIEAHAPWAGPVQIDLPFREPLLGSPGDIPPARSSGPWHAAHRAERVRPELAADIAALPGIVIAGRATPDPDATVALAEALGWPLFADPLSGCRVSGSIASFDCLLRTPLAQRAVPEVVIRLGGPPASKVLGQWLAACEPIEIVVAPPGLWPDPAHSAATVLDAVPLAPADHEPVPEWLQLWQAADSLAQVAIDSALDSNPLSEPSIARHLTATIPPGGMLVASSSMPVRDVEWFGVARGDLRIHANRGANGIDGVVSTAVGAALAGVRTTLLIGDVAFLHDQNGLIGLQQRNVDCTIVVIDNDGGGIFSFLPQASKLSPESFERLFGTPHGVDLSAIARAHAIEATVVDSLDQLAWEPGVRLLIVRTDRTDNVGVHQRLNDAVAEAVAKARG